MESKAEAAMEIIEELKEKTEQGVEETPAADFFMGIVLMILSTVICSVAWSWPRQAGIGSSAALFPFGIASTLFLMGLAIFIHSFQRKGYRRFVQFFSARRYRESWAHGNLKLVLASLLTALIYMIVILNVLPFEIGTFIYLVGTLSLFWRGKIYKILIISACVVAFYSLCFKVLFKLVLPGVGM
jgi:NADH:ubiquinone oxidoreductase subunit K